MEMIFPNEMWEWDSNITYGNVIPILYMGMSFQLQIPISYMGILFPHEIGEWPTIINFPPWVITVSIICLLLKLN